MKALDSGRPRGRPKQERHLVDGGTPEQQARRSALAAGGDPALTEYPLGMMLVRRLIDPQQHEAGCYYAHLYGRIVGRTQITCERHYRFMIADFGEAGSQLTEEVRARLEALLRHGKNRLLAAGRRVCDATENIAVFGRTPRFLDASSWQTPASRRASALEIEAVRTGLEVLVACYGRAAGRAGRMDAHKAPSMSGRPSRASNAAAGDRSVDATSPIPSESFRLTR